MLKQVTIESERVLSFRRPSSDVEDHWQAWLACRLMCTWLAGVGRYWDSPMAQNFQRFVAGSLLYVFFLSAFRWLLLAPLRPHQWSERRVLVFVTLTSPPALQYAITVECFMELRSVRVTNAWFIAVIEAWRVAPLVWFLRLQAWLPRVPVATWSLLAVTLIVVVLATLDLEHVLFEIMSGIRKEARSSNVELTERSVVRSVTRKHHGRVGLRLHPVAVTRACTGTALVAQQLHKSAAA